MMNRLFKPAMLLFFSLACTAPALGQIVWDGGGGGDPNWTNGLNWVGNVAPNAGNAGDLQFGGGAGLTPNADVPFVGISNIVFQAGASPFTVSGQQLSIDGPTPFTGFITNAGTSTQTINNNLLVTGGDIVFNAAFGDLVINGNTNTNGLRVQILNFISAAPQTSRVNGVISGTGGVFVDNDGIAVLSGINTFTGLVDIFQGRIQLDGDFADTVAVDIDALGVLSLGGNETVGSLEGDGSLLLNAFTLTVGDVNNTNFSGVIEGTGGLTKQGAGTLTLSGANTFTGPLMVNAGTAQITGDLDDTVAVTVGAGGTFAIGVDQTIGSLAGTGNVGLNANTLTSGDATDSVFGGVIGGTGEFIKQGTGMLTLAGINTFTGDTQINGGHVAITGSVAGNVINGSSLSGTGTIGGTLTNTVGSVTFPGTNGTIGTLNVNTNLVHNAGATIAGDISKDGGNAITSDVLNVTGTATLAAGSVISFTDLMGGGVFAPDDVVTLITTTGGVTDNGVQIIFAAPNFVFAPRLSMNGLDLEAVALAVGTFRTVVTGTNNLAIARAIDFDKPLADIAMNAHATFITQISALMGPAANAAAQAASPTSYASALESNMRTIHHHGSMNSNHLSLKRQGLAGLTQTAESGPVPGTMQLVSTANDPALLAWALQSQIDSDYLQDDGLEDRAHFYASVFGMVVDQDARNDFTGSNANVFGGQVGVDFKANDELTVGLMLGYDFTDIDFSNGLGSSNINTLRVGPYFSWAQDNPQKPQLYLNGSFTYGYHRVEVDRAVNFFGFAGAPSSDFDAHDISFYGELGWDFEFGDFTLTPFGSMQYTNYSTDSFSEVGGAALAFPSGITVESLRTLFGARVRGVHQVGDLFFATEGFLAWGHEFLNDDDITATFVGGTNSFSIDPNEGAADSAYFGVGLSGLLTESVSAYLRYEGAISADSAIHAIGLGLTIAF